MTRLLVITEHYYPSSGATAQLVSDLCCDLASGLFQITIVSTHGISNHPAINVISTNRSTAQTSSIVDKISSGLSFTLRSLLWLFSHASQYDSVLIVSNPPFIGLVGALSSLFLPIKYYFLLQDLFPRSAELSGLLPTKGPLNALFQQLTQLVISRSAGIITLSESMKCKILSLYKVNTLTVIHNWSLLDTLSSGSDLANTRSDFGNDSPLIIQYSGNLGRLHDVLTILEASRLIQQSKLHRQPEFQFIGRGAKAPIVTAYIKAYKLSKTSIAPPVPIDELAQSIHRADLCVVSLIPGADNTVAPSKIYGILQQSKPILLIGSPDSRISQFISKYQCGFTVEPGDPQSLVDLILRLNSNRNDLIQAGINSYNCYVKYFGKQKSSQLYSSVLSNNPTTTAMHSTDFPF